MEDINSRRDCIERCKEMVDMELYKKIAKHGNKKLKHLWDFTPEEILKVMTAVVTYCIDKGDIPNKEIYEQIMLRQLEWNDGDGRVRISTWAT